MALTITQSPYNGTSAHEGLWYTVLEDAPTLPITDFQFVFDITVGGDTFTIKKRGQFYDHPLGPYLYATFDAGPIVRGYLHSNFNPANAFIGLNEVFYAPFSIDISEEVNGSLSAVLTSITGKGYNNYSSLFPGSEQSIMAGRELKFLTDRSKQALLINRGGEVWLPFFNKMPTPFGGGPTFQFQVKNQAGSVVYTSSAVTIGSNELINLRISNTILSGVLPATDDFFTVEAFIPTGPITIFDSVQVNYAACSKYDAEVLVYLNRFGGYESIPFKLANRYAMDVERVKYTGNQYQFHNYAYNDPPFGFNAFIGRKDRLNKWSETEVPMATRQTHKLKLISDYMAQSEYDAMRQLIASPEVYLIKDGQFYPVTVQTASWNQKLTAADKMINLELDVNISRVLNSQYR